MRSARLKLFLTSAVALGVLAGLQAPASAIPVFARKYGYNCTMCHSNFPRLNDWGTRFRMNGYQVPGREDEDATVLQSPPPFAMRTSLGWNYDSFDNPPDAGTEGVNQFQLNGLDILSGGLFARNVGYFMVYPPHISPSRGVVGQDGTLEMLSVVFSNVGSTWLNLRAGRMEPAYVAFSVKRELSVSPYEIYEFAFPGGPAFADTQDGIEVTGYGRRGFSYAAGWLNGSGTNKDSDPASDVYLRVAKVFGQGEGQTAGQRLGLIGYFGRARPEDAPDASRQGFRRWGADASLNFGHYNLDLVYLKGSDDSALWPGRQSDFDFSGGFAQLLYMPATNFVGFARYDWVNTDAFAVPDVGLYKNARRWTLGGRYYFQDQIDLHVEYSHGRVDAVTQGLSDATENFFTTRLDFAF